MADLMAGLREQPPAEIAGVAVKQQKDYKDGSVVETATGARSQMELTGSSVLRYEMADGTSLIVRPSGTEPKVKVYILANGASKAEADEKAGQVQRLGREPQGLRPLRPFPGVVTDARGPFASHWIVVSGAGGCVSAQLPSVFRRSRQMPAEAAANR